MRSSIVSSEFGVSPGSGFFLNDDELARGLVDFADLGIHWIRSTIPWKNFQPNDPSVVGVDASYNWKGVDAFCATMNTDQWNGRFGIITTIEAPPQWAMNPDITGTTPCGSKPPFTLQGYADAAAALADRMRGTSHVFEIENSPNIGLKGPKHGDNVECIWQTPDPCGYAALLQLVYPAIHAVRPRASVLVGGIGGVKTVDGERMAADEFLQALYDKDAGGFFDGVSYHPYSQPQLPCAATDAVCELNLNYVSAKKDPYGMSNGWSRMLNARQIMVANGDAEKQIWITEFGAPTGDGFLSEDEQSTLLIAGAQRASQYDWVRQFNVFKHQDDPTGPKDEVGGDFMGLVRADGTHKPAYDAYKALLAG